MSRSMLIFLIVVAPVMAFCLVLLGFQTAQANLVGWYLIMMGGAYILGAPLYVWKKRGEPAAKKEEKGDRSFWLVQPGFFIGIFGAPLEYLYLPEVLSRSPWMQTLGWVLIAASVVIHSWARQAIRGQLSGHVQIQPGHVLVSGGPYRWIRHPGYLGYLLMVMGIAIGYSSLLSLAAAAILLLPGIIYRIRIEEALLVQEFGRQYQEYSQETRRIIPGIW